MPTDLLTIAETAALLRLSPRSIRRMVAEGRLRAYRVSPRHTLVSFADLAALLIAIEPASTAPRANPPRIPPPETVPPSPRIRSRSSRKAPTPIADPYAHLLSAH